MAGDLTQIQGGDERRRAQHLSMQRTQPPTHVPGYEPEQFLGAGAYGEVWVAVDRNTGRRVAIKFYNQRGGLDWSLLAREVEKLAFLTADRYVVQLIEVGWDADPPYYIMEYVEGGSLQDRIEEGPLPVTEAVLMFREIAVGLVHAHGKGVLHCDLKPANVLLDQDERPRLADFGQSRLAHEQTPALGTLFYMAPEQADLAAVPDATWDVYALGAILHCMLTGHPPHKSTERISEIEKLDSLEDRLKSYRENIRKAPRPEGHRQSAGVDRALADIIDRCLAVDPRRRYPNAQAVLDELDARSARRARRPLMVLGALGPALLLIVMSIFAVNVFSTAVGKSTEAVTARALESDGFAAQAYAMAYGRGFEQRYRALERVASDPEFIKLFEESINDPEFYPRIEKMRNPLTPRAEREALFAAFSSSELQKRLGVLLVDPNFPLVNSWFATDPESRQIARMPMVALDDSQIGTEFWRRDYFHGTGTHEATKQLPMIDSTYRSRSYQSSSSKQLIATVSTPIRKDGKKIGLLAVTLALGKFADFGQGELQSGATAELRQMAVLVDNTPGGKGNGTARGEILQHPLLEQIHELIKSLPAGKHTDVDKHIDEILDARVDDRYLVATASASGGHAVTDYRDPMIDKLQDLRDGLFQSVRDYTKGSPEKERAAVEQRLASLDAVLKAYAKHGRAKWLAAVEPVAVHSRDPRWLVIVQEPYDAAVGPVRELRGQLLETGFWALVIVIVVLTVLWGFVLLALNGTRSAWVARLGRTVGLSPDSLATTPTGTQRSMLRSSRTPGGSSGAAARLLALPKDTSATAPSPPRDPSSQEKQ